MDQRLKNFTLAPRRKVWLIAVEYDIDGEHVRSEQPDTWAVWFPPGAGNCKTTRIRPMEDGEEI